MCPQAKAPPDSNIAGAKQDKTPVWLYIITVPTLLIALGAVIYLAMGDNKSSVIVGRSDNSCNLQKTSCQAVFPHSRKLTLSISPRPIRERKQLHIVVRLHGIDAKKIYVNFLGQNMYMGYNRPQLKPVAPGKFAGTWTLASCGLFVEHMEWRTMVLIQTAKQRMAAQFMLETQPITEAGGNALSQLKASQTLSQPPKQSLNFSEAPQGGDFTLESASGPFSLKAQRGKVVLLYFGYTHCPDVCPTTLTVIAQAFKALKKDELARVEAVFVSVDPERDTPKKLAAYTKFFSSSIIGVTGTPKQIAHVTKQYGAVYRKIKNTSGKGYLISHSANTYVIAPNGTLNTILPDATPPRKIIKVIRSLQNPEQRKRTS